MSAPLLFDSMTISNVYVPLPEYPAIEIPFAKSLQMTRLPLELFGMSTVSPDAPFPSTPSGVRSSSYIPVIPRIGLAMLVRT